jgi:hypothetical protein
MVSSFFVIKKSVKLRLEIWPEHICIMLFFHMTKLGTLDLSSTSAEKGFFGNHAMLKLNSLLHLSIDLNFRHTSKTIEGGSPKKILEKKNVFPKKYVELRTFDGI